MQVFPGYSPDDYEGRTRQPRPPGPFIVVIVRLIWVLVIVVFTVLRYPVRRLWRAVRRR